MRGKLPTNGWKMSTCRWEKCKHTKTKGTAGWKVAAAGKLRHLSIANSSIWKFKIKGVFVWQNSLCCHTRRRYFSPPFHRASTCLYSRHRGGWQAPAAAQPYQSSLFLALLYETLVTGGTAFPPLPDQTGGGQSPSLLQPYTNVGAMDGLSGNGKQGCQWQDWRRRAVPSPEQPEARLTSAPGESWGGRLGRPGGRRHSSGFAVHPACQNAPAVGTVRRSPVGARYVRWHARRAPSGPWVIYICPPRGGQPTLASFTPGWGDPGTLSWGEGGRSHGEGAPWSTPSLDAP